MSQAEEVWTIVVGAGSGQRFGAAKQFEPLGDRRVIDHSCAVAASASHGVVVVVPPDVAADGGDAMGNVAVVAGGSSRSESVRNGLGAVPASATIICVHDAARPLAPVAVYERVVAAVAAGADAAIPAVAVTDTVKIVLDGVVVETPDRDTLVAVQTPQAFRADVLRRAHAAGAEATDDAALVEALGGRVVAVDGDAQSRKITHPDDLVWARRHLAAASEPS